MQVEDLLAEGTKYLKLLQRNSSKSLETHLLSFEINMRKQKILLAFQVILCLIYHFYNLGVLHLLWSILISCSGNDANEINCIV